MVFASRSTALPSLPKASDLSVVWRTAAYMAMLSGYLFYCYNFLLLDYVRPYLISDYGMELSGTAKLSVVQNIFITIGSLCAAPIIAKVGRRRTLGASAFAIGLLALLAIGTHRLADWLGIRALLALFLGAYYVASVNLTVALFPPQVRARLSAINSGMFSLAEIMLGGFGGIFGDTHWQWMLWLGGAPLILSPLIILLTPEDRTFEVYGGQSLVEQGKQGGWAEMLEPRWIRATLTCMLLAGLNFTGYQIFSSFVTLYLRQVRGFTASDMGAVVALIGMGSLMGGFFWAFVADRFGRRANSLGFLGAALFVGLFLLGPHSQTILRGVGLGYGLCLSCSYPWGVWFTEIFPMRLRPYGAALVHGGHIISLIAPLSVAWVSARWGLSVAMMFAPVLFLFGFVVWRTLPETLRSSPRYTGWDPEVGAATP